MAVAAAASFKNRKQLYCTMRFITLADLKLKKREKAKEEEKPYDKVKNLIGTVSSGVSDLGEGHRKHLLRKFKKDA